MAARATCWLIAAFLLAGCACAEDDDAAGKLLVLTDDNFEDTVKGLEHVLVEFYAPWCGHCQSLAPEYRAAAVRLAEAGSPVRLAMVDATKQTKLAQEYKIEGYPTIKFFSKGAKPIDYAGSRTADGIVAWIEKKTGPPCTEVSSRAELDTLLAKSRVVVAGFMADQGGAEAKLFEAAATADDKHVYVFVKGDEIKAGSSSVALFRTFDGEERVDFEGELDLEALATFVKLNGRPNVFEFSEQAQEEIFGTDIQKHFLVFSNKSEPGFQDLYAMVGRVGKKFKSDLIAVHIDSNVEDNKDVLDFVNVKVVPAFVVFEMETSKKYHPENQEMTETHMVDFLTQYLAGNIKPNLRSADLPSDWDSQPVKVVVSSNFEAVALDKSKDAFVEFYAPWCGHCKKLEPIWNELGDKFKDRKDVVIAKMDATENEVETVQVDSFPTLKLFKKDTNEVVDYQGKRELEALVAFLETGEQAEEEQGEEGEEGDYEDDEEGGDEDYEDDEGKDSAEDYTDSKEEEEEDSRQRDEL